MRLYLFQLGLIQPIHAPVPGYLIQTENGTNILIDTGFPFSYIIHPQNPPGVHFEMHEADYIRNRLAVLNLEPADIDYLICSHFDDDHAGNHALFTRAELIVQRQHYEIAKAGHPRFAPIRSQWDHDPLRYRLVDGDTVLVPGVELIETSGHVPGHQSVLVRLPETGPVLLAIDAIPAAFMLDPENRPIHVTDMDEVGVRTSTQKLVSLCNREGVSFIIHGHDAIQWPTLKQAPAFYS